MSEQILYISSLEEVEMGKRIKYFLDHYDEELEVRYEFYASTMTKSAYILDRETVIEEYGQSRLEDFGNSVWFRDMARAYLSYIDGMLYNIRGRGLALSADWLESHKSRREIEALTCELKGALYWFNIQFVAVHLARYPFLTHKNCSLCKGIAEREMISQCRLVENFSYMKGREALGTKCNKAALALAEIEDEPLVKLFILTPKQLTGIVYGLRGMKVELADFDLDFSSQDEESEPAEEAISQPIIEPVLSEVGIWVIGE